MRPPRRSIVLICTALLLGAPGAASAQAADPGFEDPLGGQTAPEPLTDGPLTDEPQTDLDPVDPPPVPEDLDEPDADEGLDDVPQDATADADELANTGLDARLFVALGAALLLTGVGLRLRTLPERF